MAIATILKDDLLDNTRRHVRDGADRVARQEAIVVRLEHFGAVALATQAAEILTTLNTSLRLARPTTLCGITVQEGIMTTVLIRVPTGEFSERMAAMREWLNDRRYETSKFTCDRYGNIFAVCVDFGNDGEAQAFRNRFSPQEVTSSSSILVNGSSIPLARPKPETMEQVSWWRLMAEEVRTDADEMSCTSAREMMGSVAETYDRLAENLERRLGNDSDGVISALG
jgi:hypothetical protein